MSVQALAPSNETALEQLKTWLREQNKVVQEIDLDTDIIEGRIIDSLQFVSFLLFIEQLRNESIPFELVQMERFRTLRSIRDNFFNGQG